MCDGLDFTGECGDSCLWGRHGQKQIGWAGAPTVRSDGAPPSSKSGNDADLPIRYKSGGRGRPRSGVTANAENRPPVGIKGKRPWAVDQSPPPEVMPIHSWRVSLQNQTAVPPRANREVAKADAAHPSHPSCCCRIGPLPVVKNSPADPQILHPTIRFRLDSHPHLSINIIIVSTTKRNRISLLMTMREKGYSKPS